MKKIFLMVAVIICTVTACGMNNLTLKNGLNPDDIHDDNKYGIVIYDGNISRYPVSIRTCYRRSSSATLDFYPESTVSICFSGETKFNFTGVGDDYLPMQLKDNRAYYGGAINGVYLGHHSVITDEFSNPNVSPNLYDLFARRERQEGIRTEEYEKIFEDRDRMRLADIEIKEVSSEKGYALEEVTFDLEEAAPRFPERGENNKGHLWITLYYAEKEKATPLLVHKLSEDYIAKRDGAVKFYSTNFDFKGQRFSPVYLSEFNGQLRGLNPQTGIYSSLDYFEIILDGEVVQKRSLVYEGWTDLYIGHLPIKPDSHVVIKTYKDDVVVKEMTYQVKVIDYNHNTWDIEHSQVNGYDLLEYNARAYIIEERK